MVLKTRRHVEAPPERPRAVPQQRPSRPVGIGGTVVAELIALDAHDTAPLPLTDWSARLADDWTHIADRHNNFAKAIDREFINFGFAVEYTSLALVSPLLAEVADLTKSRLPEWRRALAMHAEAELALYGTESEATL